MKVRVTTSNTTTAATVGANKVRGDRVVASYGVMSIDTGNGLTGGPILSTGTISANSANLTQAGVVQLNDTVTSNSITQAATPNSVNAVHVVSTAAYNIANLAYAQANSAFDQANLKLDIAGGTITGSLTIDGNLIVSGNTTTLNVETLVVEDNEIVLNAGQVGAPTLNSGIIVNRGDSTNVFIRWDEDSNNWGWSDANGNFYHFQIARDAFDKANTGYDIAVDANTTAISANITANGAYNQANLAYDQANTGTSIAQSAYDQANSAYTQANLAYTQANTGTSIAQSAYVQANTGTSIAQSAYGQANTATTIAQNAYAQANTANSTAGIALIRASDAYNQANVARDQANNAYAQANLAYDAANNAAVKVTANSGVAFSANTLSFNNTATVSVVVDQNGTNANIAFIAAPQVIVNDTYTAQGNITAAATANIANGLYSISTDAYAQANAAFNEANLKLNISGGTITGSLNVSGNLVIVGNTTYQNVATYIVDDPLIYLAANNDTSDLVDIGFMGGHNTAGVYSHSGLVRHAADGNWYLFTGLADEGHENNIIDIANTTYALLHANINAQSVIINGNVAATNTDISLVYNQANLAYTQANTGTTVAQNAYAQANLAYDAANNAAVRVTANTGSTISANVISFNNTSSIAVSVTGAGSNANISFATLNAISSKFTTDGNSNVYSLSSDVSNVNNLLVTIDGVVILPTDDYTVSGSALTLTFMPPGGLNIEARTLR